LNSDNKTDRLSNFFIQCRRGYQRWIIFLPFLFIPFIFSCGKTSVSIDERTYEPKIVIIGYLYPNQPITAIRISRNFPIGSVIDKADIALRDADVRLTDLADDRTFQLVYNPDSSYFEYRGTVLKIGYGKSYRLDVAASIENTYLEASSVTTVPEKGLVINPDESIYGAMPYRLQNEAGEIISPRIVFEQSPDASFYLLSINAMDASLETFIYDNPFGFDIQDALDGGATINDFKYRARWTRPENKSGEYSIIEINWFLIWFYGRHRLLLYAGDQNFFHFYNTHRSVQEIDGNLHEPLFDIDGEGIGVFGSAVTDTVYLNIYPNLE